MLRERATLEALQQLLDQPAYAPVAHLVRRQGVEVYVVGGAVRDCVMGRPVEDIHDVDFVVRGAGPRQLERWLRLLGPVAVVGKRFGVYKVTPRGSQKTVDVALPRIEHSTGRGGYGDVEVASDPDLPIEQDLARRDFTVNALAYDVAHHKLRGLTGSAQDNADIKNGLVRAVGDPNERFAEDYTRVLRAIRFAVQLGFEIEPVTLAAIKKAASKINKSDQRGRLVPYQMIGRELGRALMHDGARTIELLDETGLLAEVLPEIAALRGIEQYQKFHPEGDALVHTKEALARLNQHYAELSTRRGKTARAPLTQVVAVLFHDAGKATRVQIKNLSTGVRRTIKNPHEFFASDKYDPTTMRVMNIGHADASVDIARGVFKRLGFAQFSAGGFDEAEVLHAIKFHLLQDIEKMRPHKAEQILFYPDGRVRWSLLTVAKADAGPRVERQQKALARITQLLGKKLDAHGAGSPGPRDSARLTRPLINGNDLLDLGAEQSSRLGAVLSAVRDAQLAGRIADRQAALTLARQLLRKA